MKLQEVVTLAVIARSLTNRQWRISWLANDTRDVETGKTISQSSSNGVDCTSFCTKLMQAKKASGK